MFLSHILSKNNWSDAFKKKRARERKCNPHWIELCSFSKLGAKRRGGQFAVWGEPLSSEALWNPGCQERWEERRGRGEKPGKGPSHFVLLFGNELWLNPGRRQTVYKEPGITLSLSKPCNLETGPQPAIASSSWASRFKCDENQVSTRSPFIFFFFFGGGAVPNSDS